MVNRNIPAAEWVFSAVMILSLLGSKDFSLCMGIAFCGKATYLSLWSKDLARGGYFSW